MSNQKHFYQGINLHGNELSNAKVSSAPKNQDDVINLDYLQNYVKEQLEDSGLTPAFKEGYAKFVNVFIHSGGSIVNNREVEINTDYTLLLVIESIYNDRPTSSIPSVSLEFPNDDGAVGPNVQLKNVTLDATETYGITLESNQFLFAYNSTDSDNLLIKNCIFTLHQTFATVGNNPVFDFTIDLTSHIFDNIHLIILPYIGLSTQIEIMTDSIINSMSIPELGISGNISSLVNRSVLTANAINSFLILIPAHKLNVHIDFLNSDNQITTSTTIPINDLLKLPDGTPLQQTQIVWNGMIFRKGLLHLGYISQNNITVKVS